MGYIITRPFSAVLASSDSQGLVLGNLEDVPAANAIYIDDILIHPDYQHSPAVLIRLFKKFEQELQKKEYYLILTHARRLHGVSRFIQKLGGEVLDSFDNWDNLGEPFDLVRLKLVPWHRLAKKLIDGGYRKYQFLLGFLKKQLPMYGKSLLVDDGFYVTVNQVVSKQLKQRLSLNETNPVADLLVDFLEELKWPVDVRTVADNGGLQNTRDGFVGVWLMTVIAGFIGLFTSTAAWAAHLGRQGSYQEALREYLALAQHAPGWLWPWGVVGLIACPLFILSVILARRASRPFVYNGKFGIFSIPVGDFNIEGALVGNAQLIGFKHLSPREDDEISRAMYFSHVFYYREKLTDTQYQKQLDEILEKHKDIIERYTVIVNRAKAVAARNKKTAYGTERCREDLRGIVKGARRQYLAFQAVMKRKGVADYQEKARLLYLLLYCPEGLLAMDDELRKKIIFVPLESKKINEEHGEIWEELTAIEQNEKQVSPERLQYLNRREAELMAERDKIQAKILMKQARRNIPIVAGVGSSHIRGVAQLLRVEMIVYTQKSSRLNKKVIDSNEGGFINVWLLVVVAGVVGFFTSAVARAKDYPGWWWFSILIVACLVTLAVIVVVMVKNGIIGLFGFSRKVRDIRIFVENQQNRLDPTERIKEIFEAHNVVILGERHESMNTGTFERHLLQKIATTGAIKNLYLAVERRVCSQAKSDRFFSDWNTHYPCYSFLDFLKTPIGRTHESSLWDLFSYKDIANAELLWAEKNRFTTKEKINSECVLSNLCRLLW